MKRWLLTGIGLLLAWCAWTQVQVSGQVDTTDILIGDQIRYTLTVSAQPGTTIEQVGTQTLTEAEGFELIRMGRLDTVARQPELLLTQEIILTSFDSGDYYLPELPVTYLLNGTTETVRTNPIPVRVRTIPVSADNTDLQPIKPIIEEPLNLWDVLPYILAVLGLVLLVILIRWLLRRKRTPQEEAPPPPPRPAHEVALEKLQELANSSLLDEEEYKNFQSELTTILRVYLEGRYGIRARESTTEEIMAQMEGVATQKDWRQELRAMLQTADLVKFAKAKPPRSFHEDALHTVRSFVENTIPEPEPVVDEHDITSPQKPNVS